MSSTNKPQTVKANAVDVWGARGPQGTVVRSSISNYKSVAERWRLKRGPGYELVHFTVNLKDVPTFKIQAKSPRKVTDAKKLGILLTEEPEAPKKPAAKKKAAAKKTAVKTKKTVSTRKATKSATPAARRKRVQSSPEPQSAPVANNQTVVVEDGAAL